MRPAAALAILGALLLIAAAPAAARSAADLKCFGAADRDPERPCLNQRLKFKVTPTPQQAKLQPNLACSRKSVGDVLEQCSFGTPARDAVETVAVVGDSHAAHWRAAIAVVAAAKKWRVLEIATPHCPLSTNAFKSGNAVVEWCQEWNDQLIRWLGDNPKIRTVFMSAHTRAPIVVPAGKRRFTHRVDGFVEAWRRLPVSVQRIVVIRDNPIDTVRTHGCVARALRRHQAPAGRCANSRRNALVRDAGVDAAKKLRGRGARAVDLTSHFCGRRVCYPVVGGVLVHKDVDHLTQLFSRTLGPFLLRAYNRLEWPPAAPYELPSP